MDPGVPDNWEGALSPTGIYTLGMTADHLGDPRNASDISNANADIID